MMTICRTTWRAFLGNCLSSLCRRHGVRLWQGLNGRLRSFQNWGKGGLKGNFQVIEFNTLYSFLLPPSIQGINPPCVLAVPLRTYPASAQTPPGSNIWYISQTHVPKKLGLYPVVGNGILQDSGPFFLVLLKDHHWCETWVEGRPQTRETS